MSRGAVARMVVGGVVALAWAGTPAWGNALEIWGTIDGFGHAERGNFLQTGPGAVALEGYEFAAAVGPESAPAENVTAADFRWVDGAAMTHTAPMPWNPLGPAWSHDDPGPYASLAALETAYGPTNDFEYDLAIDGFGVVTAAIPGPPDLWPDRVPEFDDPDAFDAADPAGDLVVTFPAFTPPTMANLAWTRVRLFQGAVQVWYERGDPTMTSVTIPGGTMAPGVGYRAVVEYQSRYHTGSLTPIFPDSVTSFSWYHTTGYEFVALPAPGVAALLALAGAGLARRRRA
jgi:hypothetical protein